MYHRALYCEINDILLLVVINQLIDWHMVVFVVVFAFAVVVEDAVVEDAVAAYQLFVSLADAFAYIVAVVVEVAAAV
jgi:hypothetical protein